MKLIVILADGISADYFATFRGRLPNLSRAADRGTIVHRLKPDVPAVSLPARVTMITGLAPKDHGVYGNKIYDERAGKFRYSGPHDYRAATLGKLAMAAGLTVANVGYGMAPAAHSQLYDPPWWLNEYIYKSRVVTMEKAADNPGWQESLCHHDHTGLWSELFGPQRFGPQRIGAEGDKAGLPRDLPNPEHFRHGDVRGIAAELLTAQWVAALACAPKAPDLILTEWSMTDELQHMTGYGSDASHMAMALTDLYVGDILRHLEYAGRSDDYAVAVVADHGHKSIATAIYPEAFLPEGMAFAAEGMQLLVQVSSEAALAEATAAFKDIEVSRYPDDYLPPKVRGKVACFLSPEGTAFEDRPKGRTGATGPTQYLSNHGLTPGDPADDRLCIFTGGGIAKGEISAGASVQLMPTCAKLLGIDLGHELGEQNSGQGYASPLF